MYCDNNSTQLEAKVDQGHIVYALGQIRSSVPVTGGDCVVQLNIMQLQLNSLAATVSELHTRYRKNAFLTVLTRCV